MSFLYEFTASCMCVECLCLGSLGLLLLSLLVFLKGRELFTRNRFLTVTLFWLHTSTAPPPSHGCVLWAPRAHLTLGKIEDAQLMLEFRCCAESPGHRIAHLLTHLLAYETKLFARMNHDDALVFLHRR